MEHFSEILDFLKKAEVLSIKEIYVEHYGSIFEEIFAAYFSEVKGATINQLQQGGFVGETMVSVEPMKRVLYDRLLTYGWSLDIKDEPYYAVRLEQFKEKYFSYKKNDELIDVLIVYGSAENSKKDVEAYYFHCTSVLLNLLDGNKYSKLKLRPRAASRLLRLTKLPKVFENVSKDKIDRGYQDISKLRSSASIVIQLSVPSTNFLECIFVDQPVIGIDKNIFPTSSVKPFLTFFHEVGILHNNIESLIAFLNNVNLDEWWLKVKSEPMYAKFKDQFARSKKQYLLKINSQC